jgi:hypothetical protein
VAGPPDKNKLNTGTSFLDDGKCHNDQSNEAFHLLKSPFRRAVSIAQSGRSADGSNKNVQANFEICRGPWPNRKTERSIESGWQAGFATDRFKVSSVGALDARDASFSKPSPAIFFELEKKLLPNVMP